MLSFICIVQNDTVALELQVVPTTYGLLVDRSILEGLETLSTPIPAADVSFIWIEDDGISWNDGIFHMLDFVVALFSKKHTKSHANSTKHCICNKSITSNCCLELLHCFHCVCLSKSQCVIHVIVNKTNSYTNYFFSIPHR